MNELIELSKLLNKCREFEPEDEEYQARIKKLWEWMEKIKHEQDKSKSK